MKGHIHGPITEINMTPFVDIVLVILIIFLLTATVMMPRTFGIALPKAAQADKLESVPIIISIDRAGTRETVEAMNKAARKIREGMSVVIFPEGSRSPDGLNLSTHSGTWTLVMASPGKHGLMSNSGVPSMASSPLTFNTLPLRSRSLTTAIPMGLGRAGDLVTKTPTKGRSALLWG